MLVAPRNHQEPMSTDLSFDALHSAFTAGTLTPSDLLAKLYQSIDAHDGTFIALAPLEAVLARCRSASMSIQSLHTVPVLEVA